MASKPLHIVISGDDVALLTSLLSVASFPHFVSVVPDLGPLFETLYANHTIEAAELPMVRPTRRS